MRLCTSIIGPLGLVSKVKEYLPEGMSVELGCEEKVILKKLKVWRE